MPDADEYCKCCDLPIMSCGNRPRRSVPEQQGGFFTQLIARSFKGVWFQAAYDGECSRCGRPFDETDEIRADGDGGWEGRCCDA